MEVHEPPRIGRRDKSGLQAGMTATTEPGVYLEEFGGIHIEDTVLVMETGCQVLTPTPKELRIIQSGANARAQRPQGSAPCASGDMVQTGKSQDLPMSDYQALGQFRYQIRRFLHFSEAAAHAENLESQQHQMMLAIRAWDQPEAPTVGDLAAHLLLKHHSAVGLVDRLAEHGLVERARGHDDRRQVRVHLTPQGLAKLRRLSSAHREELRSSGPVLVGALGALLRGLAEDAPVR